MARAKPRCMRRQCSNFQLLLVSLPRPVDDCAHGGCTAGQRPPAVQLRNCLALLSMDEPGRVASVC